MSSPMREELPSGAVPISIGLGRRLAAQTTWAFHVAVVGYILLGWALPWPAAWWVYFVGAPFVQLGWIVFNDYCWLSIIEAKLRGEELVVVQPGGEEEARVFVAELIEKLFEIQITKRTSNAISYTVLWSGFLVACWRIYSA